MRLQAVPVIHAEVIVGQLLQQPGRQGWRAWQRLAEGATGVLDVGEEMMCQHPFSLYCSFPTMHCA